MLKGLKSLVAGVLAGTALGVLFSPKKGDEIRSKLKKDFKGGGTGLGVIKDTMTEMGKDIGETAKHAYDQISENPKVKRAIKKGVSKAKSEFNKAKKAVKGQVKKASAGKAQQAKAAVKGVKKAVEKTAKKAKKAVKRVTK